MARAYSRHDKVAGRSPDMPLEEDLVSGRHNNRSIELSPEYRGVPLCQVRTEVPTKPWVTKPRIWSAFQAVTVGLITRRSQVQILPPLPSNHHVKRSESAADAASGRFGFP